MSSSEGKRKITLVSSDGGSFEIDEGLAMQMEKIKRMRMIEEDLPTDSIHVPVRSSALSMLIDYCKKHFALTQQNFPSSTDAILKKTPEVEAFKAELVSSDLSSLTQLLQAAIYLDIKSLKHSTAQVVADRVKDKTVEEFRQIFGITNDFTMEEEEAIRRENQWAFDP